MPKKMKTRDLKDLNDLRVALEELGGVSKSADVIEAYSRILALEYNMPGQAKVGNKLSVDAKCVDLALTPESSFYTGFEKGTIDEAAAYACGLKMVLLGIIAMPKEAPKIAKRADVLVNYIVNLDNPFAKKYFITDGSGWKKVFGANMASTSVIATIITVMTKEDFIATGDKLNWLVPNFDKLLAGKGYDQFVSITGMFALEDVKKYEDENDEFSSDKLVEAAKEAAGDALCFMKGTMKKIAKEEKMAKKEKKILKAAKKAAKSGGSSSVNFTTGEKIALAVGGAVILGGAAYGAYKLWDNITDSSTTVTSHNDFSNFAL